MVTINVLAIAIALAACLPSAAVGFAFWAIEKKIDKREKRIEAAQEKAKQEADEREKKRTANEIMTIQCVNAALILSEATAKAVQRIPDAHCNGDMEAALKYADEVKHKQRDFIEAAGIESIYKAIPV